MSLRAIVLLSYYLFQVNLPVSAVCQNYFSTPDTLLDTLVSEVELIVDHRENIHLFLTQQESDRLLFHRNLDTDYNQIGSDNVIGVSSYSINPRAFLGEDEILISYLIQGGVQGLNIGLSRIEPNGNILARTELFTSGDGYLDNQGVAAISLPNNSYLVSWVRNDGNYTGIGAVSRFTPGDLSRDYSAIPNLDSLGLMVLGKTNLIKSETCQRVLLTWVEGSYEESNLFGRILDFSGAGLSPIFQINENTDQALIFSHELFRVNDSEFVVIWNEELPDFSSRLMKRHISAEGLLITSPNQFMPILNSIMEIELSQSNDGRVVMAWDEWNSAEAKRDIFGIRLDSNGNTVGSVFGISSAESAITRFCPQISFIDSTIYAVWLDYSGKLWGNIFKYDQIQVSIDKLNHLDDSTPSLYLFPNPFNPSITLDYSVNAGGPVNIAIYNILGQLVWTKSQNSSSIDHHRTVWNGVNLHGVSQPAGVYFIRVEDISGSITQRSLLVR